MKKLQITVPGTFGSLNDFLKSSKTKKGKWNQGNAMKQRDQKKIMQYLPHVHLHHPVWIYYTYYEPNRRRDHDNVSGYFHKIFQDALVKAGVIPGDGWAWVVGYSDRFCCDKKEPRIEINIMEVT